MNDEQGGERRGRRHATASGHRVEPRRMMKRYKRRLSGAQELREAQIEGMGRRDGGGRKERAVRENEHGCNVLIEIHP